MFIILKSLTTAFVITLGGFFGWAIVEDQGLAIQGVIFIAIISGCFLIQMYEDMHYDDLRLRQQQKRVAEISKRLDHES